MLYSIHSDYSGSAHSGTDSSDSEAIKPRNTISNIMYKLAKLDFTHDFRDSNLKEVDIMQFNPWKVTVRRNEINPSNWDIFYDNGILILKLKAFSGIVKRSKYMKITDKCLINIFREIYCIICHMINAEEQSLIRKSDRYGCWLDEWAKVFFNHLVDRICLRKTHYFEDVCIVFEGTDLISDDGKHLNLRLKTEMIDAKSMSLGK